MFMECRNRQSGIALATRIDITVRARMTQSDRQPTASDAATAWVNRVDAAGVARASNPAPTRSDRIMAVNPSNRGRITRVLQIRSRGRRDLGGNGRNYGGKMAFA